MVGVLACISLAAAYMHPALKIRQSLWRTIRCIPRAMISAHVLHCRSGRESNRLEQVDGARGDRNRSDHPHERSVWRVGDRTFRSAPTVCHTVGEARAGIGGAQPRAAPDGVNLEVDIEDLIRDAGDGLR